MNMNAIGLGKWKYLAFPGQRKEREPTWNAMIDAGELVPLSSEGRSASTFMPLTACKHKLSDFISLDLSNVKLVYSENVNVTAFKSYCLGHLAREKKTPTR